MKKTPETFSAKDFFQAINTVAKQNNLEISEIKKIIEEAVLKSFHSKFDPDAELELIMDQENERFELINHSKYVIEDHEETNAEYRALEIPLKEAKKINKNAKVGDVISEKVDFSLYSRSITQQVRQLFTQNVRELKKEAIYLKHKGLVGEMIDVTVTSVAPTYAILALDDGTTAFMPSKFKNTKIQLKVGQVIKVFVEEVLRESKDSQIIVSNGSTRLVKRILDVEVPEIADGTIEIMSISRVAGERTKLAVKSNNENVDPVGAIIGSAGSRINKIVERLGGEKIDVIKFATDVNLFIASALSPAGVISVLDKKDENGKLVSGYKVVITPNRHQTLAIGRRGVNARLAVELTNHRIDILSIKEAQEKGIEIVWNGNVDPSDLERIEAGGRLMRRQTNDQSGYRSNSGPSVNTFDLDKDILNFSEDMTVESEDGFKDKNESDVIFSDKDLKKMEAEFGLDDDFSQEISDFDGSDDDEVVDEQ